MKVSYKWLKELVNFDWLPEELAAKLTDAGVEVETITPLGKGLERVVVGEIKGIQKHPQADNLSICEVEIGSEFLQIVCGAPNVKEKAKVPVALIGARLPTGMEIIKTTLRGVDSFGMICSEKELGIGEDQKGIMILGSELKIGLPISVALDLEDFVLDLDLTPNRADCLSIIGVARDVGALFGSSVKKPQIKFNETDELTKDWAEVEIEDSSACPRYAARVIKDVKIKSSPFWLKRKLESVGMRPINNVVDITNFVMMETGHPLHAFDYDLFSQRKVIVRRAEDGEKFITLDEVERTLNNEVLLITDGKRPVAIAGIMGGMESEVSTDTKNVLLESAYFDPKVIRRGRIFLGISTEASQRFERGVDPNGVVNSANRVCQLLEELAEGKVLKGVVDNYSSPIMPAQVILRPHRVNQILATNLKSKEMVQILKRLDMEVRENQDLQVRVPTFRPDLSREIDLIEEITRIYGYDKIETSLRASGNLVTPISEEDKLVTNLRRLLVGKGFFEVLTNNLVDPRILKKLCPDLSTVNLQNALSEEMSVLATSLAQSLLSVISWNKNRKEEDLRIFELGKVYIAKENELPEERLHLCLALLGKREPIHWGMEDTEVDLYDLKGVLESLVDNLYLSFRLDPQKNALLKSDNSFEIKIDDETIGISGEVAEEILELFEIEDKVFAAELDFEKLLACIPKKKAILPLPKFPPVDRDIAMVIDEEILSERISDKIKMVGGDFIEELSLFDLYRGKQIPPGKKSLAYSIRYRSKDKTLTDEEVEKIHQKVISKLKKSFGASLRK
ncbi:MAG: phenylalanine--tRNA ligase subunit beta [candidate division Zixibacteria bacterium]|nr:phenylalanine--tRNA ligase subunit beta [candidate division Zixibacteria bacterium]